jgi:hypothetical protein
VSITSRSRGTGVAARLAFVLLVALTLTGLAAITPPGAAARDDHQQDQSSGQGDPGAYRPGDAAPAGDSADQGVTGNDGGAAATVTSDLNLRSGPGLDAAIIAVMPTGSVVQITGDAQNGFYPVNYDGTSGYASGDYLGVGGTDETSGEVDTSSAADTSGAAAAAGGDIVSIIYAAAAYYGQNGDDMLRVATCESGLDPNNVTPPYDASGLFQFLPSTWASTPYASQSIFDPVANAYAAAWMWSVGRRGEWVCQ